MLSSLPVNLSDAATAIHQLYLFFVYLEDGTIRIRFAVHTDNEAVGQRGYLIVVSDSGHRASLRNNVLEVVEQAEKFL